MSLYTLEHLEFI